MPRTNSLLLSSAEQRGVRKDEGTTWKPSLLQVHLVIMSVQIMFGGGAVVARLGLPSTNPVLFAFIRESIAGPLLCIFAWYQNRTIPKLADWSLFAAPGLFLFLNQLLFITGVKLSSSVTGSAWQPSQGIMAIILGICLGTEKNLDRLKIIGILIGTGGAVFMVLFHSKIGGGHSLWSEFGGSFCFFGNCMGATLYVILSRKTLEKYSSSITTAYSYLFATIGTFITCMIVSFDRTLLDFLCKDCNGHAWEVPIATIGALCYWILIQSVTCYALQTWANQFAEPSINLAYTVLQPLTSAAVSELLLFTNVIRQCHGSKDQDKTCLYGASLKDLGAIAIVIGLYFVIYSDRQFNLKQGNVNEVQTKPINSERQQYSQVNSGIIHSGPLIFPEAKEKDGSSNGASQKAYYYSIGGSGDVSERVSEDNSIGQRDYE